MPVYRRSKSDADGRGIARELAALSTRISAATRRPVGDVPDPTPAPTTVDPGPLTALMIRSIR